MSQTASRVPVQTGLERLLTENRDLIRGRRVGLLCNPVSVDRQLRHAADLLNADPDWELVRLFGPEHGVRGAAQDMIAVGEGTDDRTGLPVVSLYGTESQSLRPTPQQLEGIDVLVCDLQDIGSRYYTYVWTVAHCLEAAAAAGIEVVVCDRPNPLGGMAVEGGTVHPGFESFVGHHPVANRHGMTLGELIGLYRQATQAAQVDVPLTVVPMRGWRRELLFDACDLPWIMPSPNMPTLDTALVYPGLCLVEGTELSEGRGTTRPFELVGATYIAPNALAEALDRLSLPGVSFRPAWFEPQFQKHAGSSCGGVQLHVTDRRTFRPYLTGVALIATVRRLYPDEFQWRTQAYEFVTDKPAFDLLTGNDVLRRLIEEGADLPDLQASWQAEETTFLAQRAPHLLYK
jgi:uncharacterized protein YbbC (DUF1343 family)